MKPALIDTNILSLFFRNQPRVVERFEAYMREHGKINISIITYYEILSGLKHRDAQKQLADLIGTEQLVIAQLEDADYEGYSLSMLQKIACALNQKVEIALKPLEK